MTVPATVSAALIWQYQDQNGAWQDFGKACDLGSLTRTRRFALGPRKSVTAQAWRLVKKAGQDWGDGKFTAGCVRAFAETDRLSRIRISSFCFDDADQRYFLVRTDQNVEVYHLNTRVASIPVDHTDGNVQFVRSAEVLDTLLLFHQDVVPQRITRQGAHDQWDCRPLAFGSLPVFDYTGAKAGGVNEVQQLQFKNYAAGDTFNITLESETTPSLVYSAVGATLAATIQSALEALPNVGIGGVAVANTGVDTYRLTFQGANAAEDVGEIAPRTLVSDQGLALGATLTQGVAGGEPIISATRGWPSCGAFYQGRLYMAGLKSRPQTVLGSRIGDWFEFKTKGTTATVVNEDLDTDQTTTVQAIFPGQHLQLFTSSAEFFFPTEPIVPPAPIKKASRRGIAPGLPLTEIAGATLFVAAGGGALAEFVYQISGDITFGGYSANFLSKWANHLFAGTPQEPHYVVDMGFRRAKTATEADRAILPRDDGIAVVMEALREDDVTGFVRWTTNGQFVAACADLGRDEYLAVVRQVGERQEVLIERTDPNVWHDSAVITANLFGPVEQVACPWLDGQTVSCLIDGDDAGDVTVANGIAILPRPALLWVSLGLTFTQKVITLPAPLQQDQRGGDELNANVGKISVECGPSTSFAMGLVDGKAYRVKNLPPVEIPAGSGPIVHPQSGWGGLEGVPGFRADAQVQIVKTRPGPLQIKQIVTTIGT